MAPLHSITRCACGPGVPDAVQKAGQACTDSAGRLGSSPKMRRAPRWLTLPHVQALEVCTRRTVWPWASYSWQEAVDVEEMTRLTCMSGKGRFLFVFYDMKLRGGLATLGTRAARGVDEGGKEADRQTVVKARDSVSSSRSEHRLPLSQSGLQGHPA